MNRTRLHAWAIAIFLAAEWTRYVWGWRPAIQTAALALALAGLCTLVRRAKPRLLAVSACSVAVGLALGSAWSVRQPAHPLAPPGAWDVFAGQVQSVKVARRQTEILVAVRQEGEPARRCHFQALVFAEGGARVAAGEWVRGKGMWEASDRAPTAMDLLSPLVRGVGRVYPLDRPPSFGDRWTAALEADMEKFSPGGGHELIQLALSMVFGDAQGQLTQRVSSDFLAAGVTHLLVASGSNVGFALEMAAIPWQRWLARPWSRHRRVAYGVYALGVVFTFAWICNFQLAILRAACGAMYAIAAAMCRRRVQGYTVLWASAGCAGALDPADLLTPSMLLSLYAAFAVCEAEALWRRARGTQEAAVRARRAGGSRATRLGAALVRGAITTAIVDAYLVPVLWWMFRQWTPYAAVTTALLEPAVEMLMPLIALWGLATCAACLWAVPPLTWMAIGISHVGCATMAAIVWFVHFVASWRGSLQALPPMSFGCALALVACLITVAHARFPDRRR